MALRIINLTGCIQRSQRKIFGIGIVPAVGIEYIGRPGSRSGSIGVDMYTMDTAEVIVLLDHIRRHLGLGILAGGCNIQHKLRCYLLDFVRVRSVYQLFSLASCGCE